MTYKVLVVDDSSFFRRRVSDIINSDENLTVIDVAVGLYIRTISNGPVSCCPIWLAHSCATTSSSMSVVLGVNTLPPFVWRGRALTLGLRSTMRVYVSIRLST